MSKVWKVFPPDGWGSNDMIIVADTRDEAEQTYYKESNMLGEYYVEATGEKRQTMYSKSS